MPKFTVADLRVVVQGLDHPEGVACTPEGHIVAGGEAGQIYEIPQEGGIVRLRATTGGFVLGLAVDADNNVYACDLRHSAIFKVTPGGDVSLYTHGDGTERIRVPNFPSFDAAGNLYISDSGDYQKANGRVWKVRPGGQAEIWTREVCEFPNGTALSPDGRYLYVVESTLPGVVRVPIRPDGSAGAREVVATLFGTVPDGIAFDVEGNLYITCYRPDVIYILRPNGKLDLWIDDTPAQHLRAPTNIAFYGAKRDQLVIAALGGWNLMALPAPVPGHRLHYPKIG